MDITQQIQSRLEHLVTERADLGALTPWLAKPVLPDEEFHRVIGDKQFNTYVSGALRRIVLLDPEMYGHAGAEFYRAYFERLMLFLSTHPEKPLEYPYACLRREDVPSHYSRFLGTQRLSGSEWIDALCELYIQCDNGAIPHRYQALGIDTNALSPLKTLVERRKLSPEMANQLLSTGQEGNWNWYFQTQIPNLFLHNVVIYLAEYFKQDRRGGKLQDKIPAKVTNWFGIRRISIPHLAYLMDVLTLYGHDLIDLQRLSDDPLHICEIEAGSTRLLNVPLKDHIRQTLPPCILNTQRLQDLLSYNETVGIFDTGYYFNRSRLNTHKQFEHFRPYYDAIDDQALRTWLVEQYACVLPEFGAKLFNILQQYKDQYSGIALRDLSNNLFMIHSCQEVDKNIYDVMPPVSKYFFGMAEPESTGTGKRHTQRDNPTKKWATSIEKLDSLLDVWKMQNLKMYVLMPGYQNPLPKDGLVLMPRSIAKMYRDIPARVKLVGEDRLEWGVDPYKALKDSDSNLIFLG